VKAVILVGGEGTRLRPLTLSVPKQMLPIVGRPMIEHVLAQLARHGVDEAILSLGYLPDAFLAAYPEGMAAGVRLRYAVEPEPLDTAGAVRFAAGGDVDETFVVVNGDVLTDLDLSALAAFHRERGAQATIALHPVPDPSAFGVVPTDAEGRVVAFVEKPARHEATTNLINAGTYLLEPAVLQRIPSGRRVSIERETFPAMARDGVLFAKADDGYWLDTGTPQAYLQANWDVLCGARGFPPAPAATSVDDAVWTLGDPVVAGAVKGPSFIGDGAVIAQGACVERCVVGPGVMLDHGADVSDSVLLDGARVAASASVKGSILGPGSMVGERCEIRALSVLGAGAVVPSGTVVDGERVAG
jgi:NDP-sugar pyrophosphorylase family protein